MAARVLVIDDDPTWPRSWALPDREGYEVEIAADGATGLDRALADPPDLVVLDLMLPGLDGLEVCRRLRAVAPVPVIMLTARGEETDRIVGLELGADDYVAKPFSPRELTARVKAVLRRAQRAAGRHDGPDPGRPPGRRPRGRRRRPRGPPSTASWWRSPPRSSTCWRTSWRHPRRAFRREELLEQVWGYSYGDTSTVTVHVRRLREKIEADPSAPRYVRTVWGVGYRFEP